MVSSKFFFWTWCAWLLRQKKRGTEFWPTEPGVRWANDVPCEAGPPAKPHLFMTPWNPLPTEVPLMSTYWPGAKWRAFSSVPDRNGQIVLFATSQKKKSSLPIGKRASSETMNSTILRFGGTSCFAKWPAKGALTCLSLAGLQPISRP